MSLTLKQGNARLTVFGIGFNVDDGYTYNTETDKYEYTGSGTGDTETDSSGTAITLTSIDLTLSKTEFAYGSDFSGAVVKATWSDGTVTTVTNSSRLRYFESTPSSTVIDNNVIIANGWSLEDYAPGTHYIRAIYNYNGPYIDDEPFTINDVITSIKVKTEPTNVQKVGEKLDFTGLVVVAEMVSGEEKILSNDDLIFTPSEGAVITVKSNSTTTTDSTKTATNEKVGTGNGTTKSFALDYTPEEIKAVSVGGVVTTAYRISGRTITFTDAPAENAQILVTYTYTDKDNEDKIAYIDDGDTKIKVKVKYIDKDNNNKTHSDKFDVELVSIKELEWTTAPTATRYVVGDTLDLAGAVLTATYTDKTQTILTYKDGSVIATYKDKDGKFIATDGSSMDDDTSSDSSSSSSGSTTKKKTKKEEDVTKQVTFVLSAAKTTSSKDDDKTRTTLNDTDVKIVAGFAGKSADQEIKVAKTIEWTNAPNKVEYTTNETLDLAGAVITVTYTSGATETFVDGARTNDKESDGSGTTGDDTSSGTTTATVKNYVTYSPAGGAALTTQNTAIVATYKAVQKELTAETPLSVTDANLIPKSLNNYNCKFRAIGGSYSSPSVASSYDSETDTNDLEVYVAGTSAYGAYWVIFYVQLPDKYAGKTVRITATTSDWGTGVTEGVSDIMNFMVGINNGSVPSMWPSGRKIITSEGTCTYTGTLGTGDNYACIRVTLNCYGAELSYTCKVGKISCELVNGES